MPSTSKSNVDLLKSLRAFSSTSTQSIGDKLAEALSFQDYGAVGDGNTDDTAALAAALASGKKQILGNPGSVYVVSSSLTLPNNLVLDLRGATLKRKAGTSFIFDILKGTSISGTTVKNGTIDGNKDIDGLTPATAGYRFRGLALISSNNCVLENVTVQGTVNAEDSRGGIYLESCSSVRVNRCAAVSNAGVGFYANLCDRIWVDGLWAYSNTGRGLSTAATNNSTFTRIWAYSNGTEQGVIRGYSCEVADSRFTDGGAYALLQIGENVSGNYAHGCLVQGVVTKTGTAAGLSIIASDDVSVYGLKVSGVSAPTGAVLVDTCNRAQFSQFSVTGSSYDGIRVISSNYVQFHSGDSYLNAAAGIRIFSGTNAKIHKAVSCFNNVVAGVYFTTGGGHVMSGTCYDDRSVKLQQYGVVWGTSSNYRMEGAVLAGNLTGPFYSPGAVGIMRNCQLGLSPQVGTLQGVNGSSTVTFTNDNAYAAGPTLSITPINAAARTLGIPVPTLWTDGVSVVLSFAGTATGGELYTYVWG